MWSISPARSQVKHNRRVSAPIASLVALCALSLAGCASKPASVTAADVSGPAYQSNDPLERGNRVVWTVDIKLDHYVLRPVAKTYRDDVPRLLQSGLNNLLRNLKSPIILANDVLQWNGPRAGATAKRILINTVFGLGGLFDVASKQGIPYHDSDFGQTLGVWGMGPGPYLVLPLLGPSDPRDLAGYGVDTVADPFSYGMRQLGVSTQANLADTGANVINDRSKTIDDMDDLERNSLDFYAAVRSLYQQKRQGDIEIGKNRSP